jgi:hypothetical protein
VSGGQSASQPWCQTPSGVQDEVFVTVRQLRFFRCGEPSLTRGQVCSSTCREGLMAIFYCLSCSVFTRYQGKVFIGRCLVMDVFTGSAVPAFTVCNSLFLDPLFFLLISLGLAVFPCMPSSRLRVDIVYFGARIYVVDLVSLLHALVPLVFFHFPGQPTSDFPLSSACNP